MTTPILFSCQAQKKSKIGTLAKQTFGATDLIYGMYTQLHFGSNMGGIPPGYTSSHWCVNRKSATKKRRKENNLLIEIGPKELDPRKNNFNIYFGS